MAEFAAEEADREAEADGGEFGIVACALVAQPDPLAGGEGVVLEDLPGEAGAGECLGGAQVGELDLERGDVVPARARVERLVEWVLPVAEEIGAAPWLRLPERNAAERQIARRAEGADFAEIYAEQVRATVPATG